MAKAYEGEESDERAAARDRAALSYVPTDPFRGRAAFAKSLSGFSEEFIWSVMKQVQELADNEDEYNLIFGVIGDLPAKTTRRVLLAVQLGGTQLAINTRLKQIRQTDDADILEVLERILNKLMRTYMQQLEALECGQTNEAGPVQNFSVSNGGQAIILQQHQQSNGDQTAGAPQQPALTKETREPMERVESATREPVPMKRQQAR